METYFTIDTLLQGFITVFFIVLGSIVFFTDHLEKDSKKRSKKKIEIENKENLASSEDIEESISSLNVQLSKAFIDAIYFIIGLKSISNGKGTINAISNSVLYVLVIVVSVFVMGIFSKTGSEIFMDQSNSIHLGNKCFWADSTYMSQTSYKIRISSFDKIYKDRTSRFNDISEFDKSQHYYFTKHEILHNPKSEQHESYKASLESTNSAVEYSAVFALSFFILYIFAWLNLISIQIRLRIDRKPGFDDNESKRFRMVKTIYYALLLVCFILIFIGSVLAIFKPNSTTILPSSYRLIYFFAINLIPIFMWAFIWYQAKQKEAKPMLIHSPNVTYRDIFMKHYFTLIFLFIGLIGYISSSFIWFESEKEKNLKVFGMYINIEPEFNKKQKEKMHELFELEKFCSDSTKND